LTELEHLLLGYNRLEGEIPPEVGNLTNLKILELAQLDLTGPIPPEIGGLNEVLYLWLHDSGLTGTIPPELGDLSRLLGLALHNNKLTGPIPTELGQLRQLQSLELHGNALTGEIPVGIFGLPYLMQLWLDDNSLTGSVTPEMIRGGYLLRPFYYGLAYWFADNNSLSGSLPPQMDSLAPVRFNFISLAGNDLTGRVPSNIGIHGRSAAGDLRRNRLSGCIPWSWGAPSWRVNPQRGPDDLPANLLKCASRTSATQGMAPPDGARMRETAREELQRTRVRAHKLPP